MIGRLSSASPQRLPAQVLQAAGRYNFCMAVLEHEIATFEENRKDLEASSMGKWVLVFDHSIIGTFDSFEDAADHAVGRFGAGPYLIRQVGTSSVTLPASVLYSGR